MRVSAADAKESERAMSTTTSQIDSTTIAKIGGLSVLKGVILYGATSTFVGLYGDFIVKISAAQPGTAPRLDATLVSAAAALAGVLGSAFALEIGTVTDEKETNPSLKRALEKSTSKSDKFRARIRQLFSLEPSSTEAASWPKTFGIWAYAVVASAVAITYIVNQHETPSTIKALAVAFAGYVLALINAAYRMK
jgi:hypothetical protein